MLTKTQKAWIQSYFVSAALSFWSACRGALSLAIAAGVAVDFRSAVLYLFSAKVLFLLVAGAFLDIGPYYRGRQGIINTTTADAEYDQAHPPLETKELEAGQRDTVV